MTDEQLRSLVRQIIIIENSSELEDALEKLGALSDEELDALLDKIDTTILSEEEVERIVEQIISLP